MSLSVLRSLGLSLLLASAGWAQDVPKLAGSEVPLPKRTKSVQPVYPPEAIAKGLRGIVILELIIDTEGKVSSVEVIRSVPPFDEVAVAAARQWEYEATKVDGKPVRVRLSVPINFVLKMPEMTRQDGIPELRQGAAPAFPAGVSSGEGASVTAEVTLDPQGQVAEAQITSGQSPWSEALLQALRSWRFVADPSGATLAFRVQADFSPASKGGQGKVALSLSGLRREIVASAAPTEPAAESPAPSPSSPPAAPALPAPPGAPAPSPAAPATVSSPAPGREPAPVAPPKPVPVASPAPGGPPPSSAPAAIARPGSSPEPASPKPAKPAPPTEGLPAAPASGVSKPAGPGEAGVSSVRDVTLSAGVPDLVRGRRPVAPPLARMSQVSGVVEVQFAVDAGGTASVTSTTGPELLKSAAEQAVASWVFRRTTAERLRLVAELTYRGDNASAKVRLAE